jgi:integrase
MNPAVKIGGDERPQQGEATKQYLTFDEVKAMVDTPCKNEMIKKAFLFSCFCGLRYSDVKNLTWKKIQEVATGTYQVEITQQKTGETLYLPLSDNALTWLPERLDAKDDDVVFNLPSSPTTIEKHLGLWAEEAGVKKHVTFHVSRHTNATLMLYFGADIYMVSKLLGHTNVRTTQVYAKIVDESKRKAVNLIPSINLK